MHHPWMESLVAGELSEDRFRFWQAHNLSYVGEPISLVSLPRIPRDNPLRYLLIKYAAHDHDTSLADVLTIQYGPDVSKWWWAEPARDGFTNFLTRIGYEGTFGEICCANYPCFSFGRILAGPYFAGKQAPLPLEQRAWLEELVEPLTDALFLALEAAINDTAEVANTAERESMRRVLLRSTQHQTRTLDAAWALRGTWDVDGSVSSSTRRDS